jgi:hypothetical protein
MNYKNLYVIITLQDDPKKFKVEDYQKNSESGHNELLIRLFNQNLWVDAQQVKLYKGPGSAFCWKDYQEGKYIELNETNSVCPECGWWKCNDCGSCYCNKS